MNMKREPCHWFRHAVRGLALACLLSTSAFADDPYEIRLLGQTWTPPAGVTSTQTSALLQQASAASQQGLATIHALVQLYDIPDEAAKGQLAGAGLDLGAYVTGNAWIAAIPVGQVSTAAARPEVRWIEPWSSGRKLHPDLTAGQIGPWARNTENPDLVLAVAQLHHDIDLFLGAELATQAGAVSTDDVEGIHGVMMWIPSGGIAALAAREEVLWIDTMPAPLSAANDGIREQMKVKELAGSEYALDGAGVKLFVYDTGRVRGSHETFNDLFGSRVTSLDGSPLTAHATHVAGTAAGDGSGSFALEGRGMAPAVSILSAGYEQTNLGQMAFIEDIGDIVQDFSTARNAFGADLANMSLTSNVESKLYPCGYEGDYGPSSVLLDQIVRGTHPAVDDPMVIVGAAGNERALGRFNSGCSRDFAKIPPPGCAKNPIHVGAINSDGGAMTSFSSWGPCDDGRLKPTVVAPGCETGRVANETYIDSSACSASPDAVGAGCSDDHLYAGSGYCGTSSATAAVSGTVALLLEDWRQHLNLWLGPMPPRLSPAQVKAALIHTARDLGVEGPDYRFGYGSVDAQALIDLERATGTGNGLGGPGLQAWGTGSVSQGQVQTYLITVPSGIGELKATMAWDDYEAAAMAASQLVNDLDLTLIAPDSTVYRSWLLDKHNPEQPATTGINHLDNQEQVLVKNPAPGVWTVRVHGFAVPQGPQTYGLVYAAKPRTVDEAGCTALSHSSFETGNDGWTFANGALRVAAPPSGHGAWSARLTAGSNGIQEVKRMFDLTGFGQSAIDLSYAFHMTTTEILVPRFGTDFLQVEIREAGVPTAVIDFHDEAEKLGQWLPPARLDLSPWAGKVIEVVFRSAQDAVQSSDFFVDDVQLRACPKVAPQTKVTYTSNATYDGHVVESTETSSLGGQAFPNGPTVAVGDTSSDQHVKGVVSFDTSGLPDNAVIVSAKLVLYRSSVLGTNPFATHNTAWLDVKTGAFNNFTLLEPGDFQALATSLGVSILSNPAVNGDFSHATFPNAGLAAINKTGLTQLRLYFGKGDDDDAISDLLYFAAGENANPDLRPRLFVEYLLP